MSSVSREIELSAIQSPNDSKG